MISYSGTLLRQIGAFLIVDESPIKSDAVIVLNTGMEYYPRLIEAARLYRNQYVSKIVINGNRKSDSLKALESRGFKRCCPWYENSLRILSLYGVPREQVISVSAEDAYDTISEANAVGETLIDLGYKKIIITTSKYHSRRAKRIWEQSYGDQLKITMVAAQSDPFDPESWWKDGRQIRWVLAEYGAWLYYYGKGIKKEK